MDLNYITRLDNKMIKPKYVFMTAFEEYYEEFKTVFPDLHQEDECFINKPIGIDEMIRTVKPHLNK